MEKTYTLEQQVVAVDVWKYMEENATTLQQTYEEIGVAKEMRLTNEDFNAIIKQRWLDLDKSK